MKSSRDATLSKNRVWEFLGYRDLPIRLWAFKQTLYLSIYLMFSLSLSLTFSFSLSLSHLSVLAKILRQIWHFSIQFTLYRQVEYVPRHRARSVAGRARQPSLPSASRTIPVGRPQLKWERDSFPLAKLFPIFYSLSIASELILWNATFLHLCPSVGWIWLALVILCEYLEDTFVTEATGEEKVEE